MKANFVKSIIMMMVVLVATVSASAQELVNGISTRDAQKCGEYLVKNPKDTIVEVSKISRDGMRGEVSHKVYLKGATTLGVRNDTVWYKSRVESVTKNDSIYTVVSKVTSANEVKNDTTRWREYKSSKDVPFEDKVQKLAGQKRAEAKDHKDLDGNLRHGTQATLLGGGMLVDGYATPTITGRLGYETCHFLFELEGSFSSAKHTEVAEYSGRYLSFSAQFNAGWKFWQDRRYRHYIAVLGTVGYGYQKTDGDEAVARSKNYGDIWGVFLRGSYGLSSHWRVVLEGGMKKVVSVRHNEEQDPRNFGFFLNAGIGYRF